MSRVEPNRLLAAQMAEILASSVSRFPKSIPIGTATQLFADDHLVSRLHAARRTLHPARKLGKPVIVADRPWKGERVYVYGTGECDSVQSEFRMWFLGRLGPGHESWLPGLDWHGDVILFATSKDGIIWDRPYLNRHSFDGSGENNIVLVNLHRPAVVVDSDGDKPRERFRMLAWNWEPSRYGYWRAYSADGIAWREYETSSTLFNTGQVLESITTARHPMNGTHLAFFRLWQDLGGFRRRAIGVSSSTEFYNLAGFAYGTQLLGFLPEFQVERIQPLDSSVSAANQAKWDGPIEAQFVHSHDGVRWERFDDRLAIIPRGKPGSMNAGCILALANPPLIVGDEVWVYDTAVNTRHGTAMPPKQITIGRASWRLDGFVSLDAGPGGGTVETVPLETAGDRVEVNVDASRGRLRVEVLAATGTVMSNFDLGSSEPIRGNHVRHAAKGSRRNRLDTRQPIRLRFHLDQARLYSYRIRNGDAST